MKNEVCCSCRRPKANHLCELCQSSVCKACAQFLPEDTFSFLSKIPAELAHSVYCPGCYDGKVADPLMEYEKTMEQAREIAVFFKEESKKTRLFPRKEAPYEVKECLDKDETVLRLAFFAAQDNFNAIIDVTLTSEKVINGSHKYLKWKGTAIPCKLDDKTLNQDWY